MTEKKPRFCTSEVIACAIGAATALSMPAPGVRSSTASFGVSTGAAAASNETAAIVSMRRKLAQRGVESNHLPRIQRPLPEPFGYRAADCDALTSERLTDLHVIRPH